MEVEEPKEIGLSATEWRHMYFTGITKKPLNEITLSESKIQGLLSMVKVGPVISSGVAIEPKYILNSKGATPWIVMYALLNAKKPEALTAIAQSKTRINVPSNFLSGIFINHINWPSSLLKKYDIALEGYNVFSIPFLVHESHPNIGSFSQSMKAPDGSLEIFNVNEFDGDNPEKYLIELQNLILFIKKNRPDIVAKQP